jgi:hypothetical protein
MSSARSSRLNLARWRERRGLRSADETLMVKHVIWQWYLQAEDQREPATRGGLGSTLGVSRQYVDKVIKWMPLQVPPDFSEKATVTPAEVQQARERRQQLREDIAMGIIPRMPPVPSEPIMLSQRPTIENRDRGTPDADNNSSLFSTFSPHTKPRTYQEWERLGMLDGPRPVRGRVRRLIFGGAFGMFIREEFE